MIRNQKKASVGAESTLNIPCACVGTVGKVKKKCCKKYKKGKQCKRCPNR